MENLMERTYLEKTNTVYRMWNPYTDGYGYGCDRKTPAFKHSLEKLGNYVKTGKIFIGCNTGLETKIEFSDKKFKFKRADGNFIMYSSSNLEDVAEYIWISVTVGACAVHLYI